MFTDYVAKVADLLALQRRIVGVRFIPFELEYGRTDAAEIKGKGRLCAFVNKACHGDKLKVRRENFSCSGGPHQLGLKPVPELDGSGRLMSKCGLYSDYSIGREVTKSFMRISQEIYGLEIGPLAEMPEADVVVMLGMSEQMMKIVRGYSYHYGRPQNFVSVGNAAMCSDLVAKPFVRNDINVSLMCCGARTSTVSDEGELGIGMPVNMFEGVSEGILKVFGNNKMEV